MHAVSSGSPDAPQAKKTPTSGEYNYQPWIPLILSILVTVGALIAIDNLIDSNWSRISEESSLITLMGASSIDLLLWSWAGYGLYQNSPHASAVSDTIPIDPLLRPPASPPIAQIMPPITETFDSGPLLPKRDSNKFYYCYVAIPIKKLTRPVLPHMIHPPKEGTLEQCTCLALCVGGDCNTVGGLKECLKRRGISFTRLYHRGALLTDDKQRLRGLDLARAICIDFSEDRSIHNIGTRNTIESGNDSVELEYAPPDPQLAPLPLPVEPPITDRFDSGPLLPKDNSKKFSYCYVAIPIKKLTRAVPLGETDSGTGAYENCTRLGLCIGSDCNTVGGLKECLKRRGISFTHLYHHGALLTDDKKNLRDLDLTKAIGIDCSEDRAMGSIGIRNPPISGHNTIEIEYA